MTAASGVEFFDARSSDAARLSAFARAAFTQTFAHLYAPDDLHAFLDASYSEARLLPELADPLVRFRLIEAQGALQGYAQTGPLHLPFDPGARPAWELRRLYLAPAIQGQGFADALMAWALNEARERGAMDLYLGVYEDNARAIAFYGRWGFTCVGGYLFAVGKARDREKILRRALA